MAQSIACNVCSEAINSDEEFLEHLLRHQSQLSSNVRDWIQRGAKGAGGGMTTKGHHRPLSPGQEMKGHRAKGKKSFKCSRIGCNSAFTRRTDLERHNLIHYPWQEPCDHCGKRQPTAGAFRQHICLKQKATKEQISGRERLIERRLGIHIGQLSTKAVSQETGVSVQGSYRCDTLEDLPNTVPSAAPNAAPDNVPLESMPLQLSLPMASSTSNGDAGGPLLWDYFISYQLQALDGSQGLWPGDMLHSGSGSTSQPPSNNAFPLDGNSAYNPMPNIC